MVGELVQQRRSGMIASTTTTSAAKTLRSPAWFLVYGRWIDPPDEGGCAPPLQIHNYSVCDRWAGVRNPARQPLYNLRGAKARLGKAGERRMDIFTGRTTVTLSEEPNLVRPAALVLRPVDEAKGPARLPHPASGTLAGKLPGQGKHRF